MNPVKKSLAQSAAGAYIRLGDDFPNFDMGYACSVELEPGTLLTTYWYNLFGRFYLGGTIWQAPSR